MRARLMVTLSVAITAAILALSPSSAGAQEVFGIASSSTSISTTQAGAHADLTTSFALNTDSEGNPVGQLKDVEVDLPLGLVGNPRAVPRCSALEFSLFSCLPSSQVGVLRPTFVIPGTGPVNVGIGLYNLAPSAGKVATFAASLLFVTIVVQVQVREDGSYGLTAKISDLSTLIPISGASFTLWGVPADHSHDHERLTSGPAPEEPEAGVPAGVSPAAFMTNPSSCSGGPLVGTLRVDSWQDPGQFIAQNTTMSQPTGCQLLQMSPTISVTPDTTQVDSPAGYSIDLKLPQNEEPYELATPDLQAVSVTLPAGTSLSPAVANGLQGCTDAQFEMSSCPNASKVGTASITSPLLSEQLTGSVYLGAPTPSEMYRIFVIASADTVTLKLAGHLQLNPSTGQLTTVFDHIPQQPFSDLLLSFFGGPLGALANPPSCGLATTRAQLNSYGGQAADLSSSFVVDANGQGGQCPASLPFSPGFSAGTTTPMAAGFSPLTLIVSRADGEQNLSSITAQLPAGLLGMLSQVPLCGEPQASTGNCSHTSQIGSTTMGVGAGAQPLYLSGSVYLTGPYKGAPFGLAIVVSAAAGPFDLGMIVVRARILVSPRDMHLTIASDPLPQIVEGIPLRLRTVSLAISRSGFVFNPTNCLPQVIAGTIGSAEGSSAAISSPFQMAGCSRLPFAPKLTAATQAKASSGGNGASLKVQVANPAGMRANISSVIVELPGQLRPRLTTIQQACLAATFFADPGACPADSIVGKMTVSTPVLATPLSGQIYLVFRGGVAYPDFVMILHSQGIILELDGSLSISRKGIISTAFRALPDAPISSLQLELPRGPHSMLGATVNLCSRALNLSYTLSGQNGAQIKHTVRVEVGGCRKRKAKPRVAAHHRHRIS